MKPPPLMRYHGGKYRLANWIISNFPEHQTYVECFGGSGAVLMQKRRSRVEIYNDLDDEIVNLMRVLRDKKMASNLVEQLKLTPFSRTEFESAYQLSDEPVEQARRTLIKAYMGFGSAGSTIKTGFKIDHSKKPLQIKWPTYPKLISYYCERIKGVLVENEPASKIIEKFGGYQDVLIYADPPYPLETRSSKAKGKKVYRHEMTTSDHIELCEQLSNVRAKVVLSSYQNDLYDHHLKGWERRDKKTTASGNKGGVPRVESLYINKNANKAAIQGCII